MIEPSTRSLIAYSGKDAVDFKATFEHLRDQVAFDWAFISTTLPRGGLQVVWAERAEPEWTRSYSRSHHLRDVVAWESLLRNEPARHSDLVVESSTPLPQLAEEFHAEALAPLSVRSYATAPLAGPLFEGFPGVLHLLRNGKGQDWAPSDLQLLGQVAEELNDATAAARRARGGDEHHSLNRAPAVRQIMADPEGRLLFPVEPERTLEPAVRENLLQSMREKLSTPADGKNGRVDGQSGDGGSAGGEGESGTPSGSGNSRSAVLMVPHPSGDNWMFRLVVYREFPAVAREREGPIGVASLPPACAAWARLRPSDIEADPELSRLIPAIQYMHQNFPSGINLAEVARSVGLSPFHFHRRFTELLGTTPKHYLFDCQIAQAKRHLLQGEKALSQIAAEAGFAHQSHFTSRFRQATGLTPSHWRRRAQQAHGKTGGGSA